MAHSWAPEVCVEYRWSRNGLRFATEDEAKAYARDLMARWFLVDDCRATAADEPPNSRWDPKHGLIDIPIMET